MPEQSVIDGYLGELERQLPASRWRRRVLAEVEDHLRSGAASSTEEGAVERFGPADALARQFATDHAVRLVRLASKMQASLLVILTGVAMDTYAGPWLTGDAGGPAQELATFVLVQVAWAAVAIAFLRAWLSNHLVRVPPAELRATLRAEFVAVGSLGLALLVRLGDKLAGGASATSPLGMAALLLPALAGLAIVIAVSRRLRHLEPLLDDDAELPSDLPALGELASMVVGAQPMGRVLGWLGPQRLVALTAAVAAACAFRLGAMPDGLWPSLAQGVPGGAMLAGGLCALVEASAVVGGYLLLRGPLALETRSS